MTDEQFIFIIKAKLKLYYQEGKSVGMELRALVADFRQEIEDDCLKFKYEELNTKRRNGKFKKTHDAPQP